MNYIFPVILSIILMFPKAPVPSTTSKENADTLHWNSQRKLTWNDFKGQPDTIRHFSAETHYVITYNYKKSSQMKSPELHFKIQCYFEQSRSWAKTKEVTNQLLDHEQAHFDIAELHTRMFRERVSNTLFDPKKYDSQIQAIFSDILSECSKMQETFDKETKYGILAEEQNNWILNIEDTLEKYGPYGKIHVHNLNPDANHVGL